MSESHEKRPVMAGWVEIPTGSWATDMGSQCREVSAWQRHRIRVISALQLADLPDKSGVGPQWHISVSFHGRRPSHDQVGTALRGFDMVGAEEDNHHPGVARHFWRPVDPAHRVDCECKADEKVIVEPDGYRWTNPLTGVCRGCELQQLTGKPCTLHQEARP